MKKVWVILCSIILLIGLAASAQAAAYQDEYPIGDDLEDLILFGSEYTSLSGIKGSGLGYWRVPAGDGPIWTTRQGDWVDYQHTLVEGNWNIGINVTQAPPPGNLPLPPSYAEFQVYNSLGDVVINIPASQNDVNYGFVNLDIAVAGDYWVRYTWLNDWYDGTYDANIQINEAFFDYNPVPIPSALLLFGGGLLGLIGIRRKVNN
jgi:hypothetical protein